MKGTSETLRLKDIARIAERMEELVRQGQLDGHDEDLEMLHKLQDSIQSDYRNSPIPEN